MYFPRFSDASTHQLAIDIHCIDFLWFATEALGGTFYFNLMMTMVTLYVVTYVTFKQNSQLAYGCNGTYVVGIQRYSYGVHVGSEG